MTNTLVEAINKMLDHLKEIYPSCEICEERHGGREIDILEKIKQLAIAERDRLYKEISTYAMTNAINDYNEGFYAATERAKRIMRGEW